eukprot:6106131-Pleurochrysis_carterae.AAC.1
MHAQRRARSARNCRDAHLLSPGEDARGVASLLVHAARERMVCTASRRSASRRAVRTHPHCACRTGVQGQAHAAQRSGRDAREAKGRTRASRTGASEESVHARTSAHAAKRRLAAGASRC